MGDNKITRGDDKLLRMLSGRDINGHEHAPAGGQVHECDERATRLRRVRTSIRPVALLRFAV